MLKMKAAIVIVLHCAAASVTAMALPGGGQVVSNPLDGYKVVPMQYKGSIKEGEDPITLNGTIQSIISQIKELNPDFELLNSSSTDSSAIKERAAADIVCDVGGFGPVDVRAAGREQGYLRSLSGSCGVGAGPGNCARVSCSYGTAIWLCNDNSWEIGPTCSYLADYVDHIIGACSYAVSNPPCTVRPCGPDWTAYFVRGQQFDSDNYNVIVGGDSC